MDKVRREGNFPPFLLFFKIMACLLKKLISNRLDPKSSVFILKKEEIWEPIPQKPVQKKDFVK